MARPTLEGMPERLLRLDETIQVMHRRMATLESQVEQLPARLWGALSTSPGTNAAIDAAVKTLADAVAESMRRVSPSVVPPSSSNMPSRQSLSGPATETHPIPSPSTAASGVPKRSTPPRAANSKRTKVSTSAPTGASLVTTPRCMASLPTTEEKSLPPSPLSWQFPTTSCRLLWGLWFHGDSARPSLGPFRHLKKDVAPTDATSKDYIYRARRVMSTIAAAAITLDLVPSQDAIAALSPDASLVVFDQAFAYVQANTEEPISPHDPYRKVASRLGRVAVAAPPPATPRVFAWAGGSTRRAPERWAFPTDMACRELWQRWFVGDDAVGPYRLLMDTDMHDAADGCHARARGVVNALVDIAVTHGMTSSKAALEGERSRAALARVFDAAWTRLLELNPTMLQTHDDPTTMSYLSMFSCLTTTRKRKRPHSPRHTSAAFEVDAQI
ncbi:Aste57867_12139 [Aphanomyces stellatus]|uniref:Aste57867_12139 protein n=1 Tax=Aphanomyces stellatus TaxID=120398 RepID=A0A485KUR9_9STRA|nr:hypothetical protein As57867_012094 [Aphanomyces stellatus]VFT88993.1 Aste57867_12139 [Aphanomyces stellatus]